MAVRPEHQNRGFGSQLVRQGLKVCKASGAAAVFVLGHPDYYPRFGFEPAAPHGLHFKGDEFAPFFMVLELRSGLLETLSGEVQYRSEFEAV